MGLGGDALDPFLPQRGSAYQPRATPWESGHPHFRILTERRRWSHPANRAALARANAEVAGSMWVIGRREAQQPECYPHRYPQKAPLGRAFSGAPWPDTDASKRREPASMLVTQGVEAGRWRRAERPPKVANWPPSTPGIHYTINRYAGQIASKCQITHTVTHKCWWLRKQASGGPF